MSQGPCETPHMHPCPAPGPLAAFLPLSVLEPPSASGLCTAVPPVPRHSRGPGCHLGEALPARPFAPCRIPFLHSRCLMMLVPLRVAARRGPAGVWAELPSPFPACPCCLLECVCVGGGGAGCGQQGPWPPGAQRSRFVRLLSRSPYSRPAACRMRVLPCSTPLDLSQKTCLPSPLLSP